MLSVIVITKNEEKRIRQCLESVRFADEIVIIDSGSQDQTVAICKEYTAKVFVMEWAGFGPQKQRALEKATGDWILSIDADEVVDENLKNEILSVIQNKSIHGYFIPRLSHFCGEPVRFGGWYPDYILRLFQKSKGRFSADLVHEKILVEGDTSRLRSHLLHYSYDNLEQVVDKWNQYSSLGARKVFENNPQECGGLIKAIVRALIAFFRIYIFKLGLLDGRVGFVIAVTSAETAFYKYLKFDLLKKS